MDEEVREPLAEKGTELTAEQAEQAQRGESDNCARERRKMAHARRKRELLRVEDGAGYAAQTGGRAERKRKRNCHIY